MAGRTTRKDEIEAVVDGRGPVKGERLVEYGLILTDAFNDYSGEITFLDNPAVPQQIDGWNNDDSYRQSRYLLAKGEAGDIAAVTENLRENSLARQLAAKEDQPATIRLIRRIKQNEFAKEKKLENRRPWKNLIPPNTKFFLEQVQESREEKVQVIDTFGEWVAFFFGRRPEVYTYSGTLLNSKNHDWKNEFQENYDNFLRGSQAVKNHATMLLQYDDVVVEGYMMNCSISQAAVADNAVPFSFSLLVLNRSPLNPQLITYLRYRRSGATEAEKQLYQNMQEALDLSKAGRLDELETFLIMREYFAGNYIPAAGKLTHRSDAATIDSESTTRPGEVGGLVLDPPTTNDFSDDTTNKIVGANILFQPNPIVPSFLQEDS